MTNILWKCCMRFVDSFIDYLESLDIEIAKLEQFGAILLIVGYSLFYSGAQYDIYEALDINEQNISPDYVTLIGEYYVLAGYIVLYVVSLKRIEEKYNSDLYGEDSFIISPYVLLSYSYLLSVIANSLRVEAFNEILYNIKNYTEIIRDDKDD